MASGGRARRRAEDAPEGSRHVLRGGEPPPGRNDPDAALPRLEIGLRHPYASVDEIGVRRKASFALERFGERKRRQRGLGS